MNKSVLAIALGTFFLIGCSPQLDCSSSDAKQLIGDITKKNNLLGSHSSSVIYNKMQEVENKIRSQAKPDLDNLKANISTLTAECKASLKQSDTLKTVEGEIVSITTKMSQFERYNPIRPPRANNWNTQNYYAWRAAEEKYQDEIRRKDESLRSLEKEKATRLRNIEHTHRFIEDVCGKGFITDIDHRGAIGRDFEGTIREAHSFIETKLAPPVKQAKEKISNFNDALMAEINAAQKKEHAKEEAKIQSDLDDAKYVLENIITTNKNEKTGAVSCKADIKADINESFKVEGKVVYTLEKTSDNKLYATIRSIDQSRYH